MYDLQHRKAKKTVAIRTADGKNPGRQKISVKQLKSDFLFGIGAFDLMAYCGSQNKEDRDFFKDRVDKALDLFHFMTVPMYWGIYEPKEGRTREEEYLKAARFLKQKGVTLKGHPLCWHTVCANWLLEYDDAAIYQKQMDRIRREVSRFKGLIDAWDVINETVIMPVFDKYDNAVTRICNSYGRVPLIKAVFEEASENNPGATLILNDFNTTEQYERVIGECLDAGVKINTIGIQSHQHQGYWGREKILDVLDRFSKFNLPIHFTENTMVSGDLIPSYIEDLNDWQVSDWPSTMEGEERQCREMEEMYRILFADSHVQAITWWDFADGAWLGAPSGLIRKDNSPKPAYHKLKEMICSEWNTAYETQTDENGMFVLEGFTGTYELTLQGKKVPYVLTSDDQKNKGVIRL